jgi:hypothetical protein
MHEQFGGWTHDPPPPNLIDIIDRYHAAGMFVNSSSGGRQSACPHNAGAPTVARPEISRSNHFGIMAAFDAQQYPVIPHA